MLINVLFISISLAASVILAWRWFDHRADRQAMNHLTAIQPPRPASAEGQPSQVRFQRWSNANPEKIHRLQPFGGYLSEFREFAGFHLPTRVEAGDSGINQK